MANPSESIHAQFIHAIFANCRTTQERADEMRRLANAFYTTGNQCVGKALYRWADEFEAAANELQEIHNNVQAADLSYAQAMSANMIKLAISSVE